MNKHNYFADLSWRAALLSGFGDMKYIDNEDGLHDDVKDWVDGQRWIECFVRVDQVTQLPLNRSKAHSTMTNWKVKSIKSCHFGLTNKPAICVIGCLFGCNQINRYVLSTDCRSANFALAIEFKDFGAVSVITLFVALISRRFPWVLIKTNIVSLIAPTTVWINCFSFATDHALHESRTSWGLFV